MPSNRTRTVSPVDDPPDAGADRIELSAGVGSRERSTPIREGSRENWRRVSGGVAVFPSAVFGLGLLWFRTGGDAIRAFVMAGPFPWGGFWLLRRFLRQAPRRREQQPQSETAMLEPRRESQDIAELKAEVSALKAEIRARRSTSASCTNERFCNDPAPDVFSRV